MSYGTDLAETYRQVGNYVGRILSGAKPNNLPVQQSAKVELILNLKTAKTLGLSRQGLINKMKRYRLRSLEAGA